MAERGIDNRPAAPAVMADARNQVLRVSGEVDFINRKMSRFQVRRNYLISVAVAIVAFHVPGSPW
jgi:hypothetical protein